MKLVRWSGAGALALMAGLASVPVVSTPAVATGEYSIGDTGPGGGTVFLTPTSAGNATGNYFEVRDPEVKRRGCQVGTSGYEFTDPNPTVGTGIGDGLTNTLGMANQCPSSASQSAFQYAVDLNLGGYDNWFIPSKSEYEAIWSQRNNGLSDVIDYGGDGSKQFVWQSQIRDSLPSESLNLFNRGSGSTTAFTTTNSSQYFFVARMFEVTTPAAPTGLSATAQDQGASITFTPGSDRGSAIIDYEYQLDGGSWQSAGTTTSPVSITGLTNGTTYSVKLRAVNGNGDGAVSSAVNVTPVSSLDPPGMPADLEVLPGGTTLSLSWEAPSPGGAPITDYEYQTDSDGWLSLNTTGTSATISTDSAGTNLDPATEYAVQIRAKNVNGDGTATASVSQVPGVPLAPQSPSSGWNDGNLALSWSAATANGDPVTEYRIVVSQLSQRVGFRMMRSGPGTYTTTSTSYTVTGLRPASSYTITLSARNGRGWGVPTSFSVAGTGEVANERQTPVPIIQQVGLPNSGSCVDVVDGMFGTQILIQGGWGRSWAWWVGNGLGGPVCTRTLVYSNALGRWGLAE